MKALNLPIQDFKELETTLGAPSALGYSMEQLARAVKKYGGHTLEVQTSLELLSSRARPFACIALLERQGHFVCINNVAKESVDVIDPPNRRTVPRVAFSEGWNGKALLISNRPLALHEGRSDSEKIWIVLLVLSVLMVTGSCIIYGRLGRRKF